MYLLEAVNNSFSLLLVDGPLQNVGYFPSDYSWYMVGRPGLQDVVKHDAPFSVPAFWPWPC